MTHDRGWRGRPTVPSLLLAMMLAFVGGCERQLPTPPDASGPTIDAQLRQQLSNWGVVPIGAVPAQDTALVRLGQALMFDKILSGNRDIACATCHDPAAHLTDGRSLSVGTGATGSGVMRAPGSGRQFGPRSAPTLLNQGLRAYQLFWDGRVSGAGAGPFETPAGRDLPVGLPNIVAAQAMFPVLNRQEMRGDSGDLDRFGNPNELSLYGDDHRWEIWRAIMNRLLAIPAYVQLFAAAFPNTPPEELGFDRAATAIAAFETQAFTRTNSPFDRYLARDDAALSPAEKRGALLFFGNAGCASCHGGALLGGNVLANVGVPQLGPGVGTSAPLDIGRASLHGQDFYRFAFRVPPLRNVELTAPYFHDGAYPTLDAVVHHYNDVPTALRTYDVTQVEATIRGMYHGEEATVTDQLQHLDFRLRTPLGLTESEMTDLVAFLKSLTDPAARDLSALVPASVPSGLPVRE